MSISRSEFTEIERKIIEHIIQGLSNKQIAEMMNLSEGTVHSYITRILNKTALKNRTQIALYYMRKISNNENK